jgi:hypothetical protein
MPIHRFRALWTLAFALSAQPAFAYLDPPYLTPANPSYADPISVNIYGGECDLVDGGMVWPPLVTQQGNDLTILLGGAHETDPEWCYYGIGTATFPVGSLPSGSYTLTVERRYTSLLGWVTETLGVIPFTVTGAAPQTPVEAPTLSPAGTGSLLLALIAAVLRNLRGRVA